MKKRPHVLIVTPQRFNANELRQTVAPISKEFTYVLGVTGIGATIDDKCVLWNELDRDERFVVDPPHGWLLRLAQDPSFTAATFDGIIISSGDPSQTTANWHNSTLLDLVRDFHQQEKPIAAICVSVPVIREAARGKHVSYFPLVPSRAMLRDSIRSSRYVTRDGNIITAEHQMATSDWVDLFMRAVKEQQNG